MVTDKPSFSTSSERAQTIQDSLQIAGDVHVSSYTLSFKPFWDHVKSNAPQEGEMEFSFQSYLLQELHQHPDWEENVSDDNLEGYIPLFGLIQQYMLPPVEDKESLRWGLALPNFQAVFYGTDHLLSLLDQQVELSSEIINSPDTRESFELHRLTLIYSFLLQKFYGYTSRLTKNLSFKYQEEETGLLKYSRVDLDVRFVEVQSLSVLPELDMNEVQKHVVNGTIISYLQKVLPLKLFHFTGFIILCASDVTVSCIEEEIRTSIMGLDSETYLKSARYVLDLLPSLLGSTSIRFGLLPLIELNNKLVDFESGYSICILMDVVKDKKCSAADVLQYLEEFKKGSQLVIIRSDDKPVKQPFLAAIQKEKSIEAFALLPIYRDKRLTGILEIVAYANPELLNYKDLVPLQGVIPSIAELVNRSIHEFSYVLNQIIRKKFTSIKPAIEWKINEVAWKYLESHMNHEVHVGFESLIFEQVYPLYGAIDIRDSSLKRNQALRDDLSILFTRLLQTLGSVKEHVQLITLDEKIEEAHEWLLSFSSFLDTGSEANIYHFLEEEINPLLTYVRENFTNTSEEIDAYFQFVDTDDGPVFHNRNNLEKAFKAINTNVSREVTRFETTLMKYYPCYFESFRTDGIEYDVYLGQSISPDKPFDLLYLKEFRLHQLIFMANIVRLTHSLLPQLEIPLQTTHLIFVNDRTIDISFREDEKRFDVEGAYNIRYQMVKKRIDKVHIKNTGERLTQPGKIAIVYFNRDVETEYNRHLAYLSKQGYLHEEIEYFELEELQGLSGLKAIRVSVNLDASLPQSALGA